MTVTTKRDAASCIRLAMTCPMTILLCAFLRSIEAFAPSAAVAVHTDISFNPASTSVLFAVPPRKAKHKIRRQSNHHNPISMADLAQHVSSQYINGPNGVVKEQKARERNRSSMENDETSEYLKTLDRHPALVLNADYQPISLLPLSMWHWQEAIKAVFAGKVTVVDVYPGVTIRAVNIEIPLPSVIALNEYVQHPVTTPAFTKRNVFLRDEYRCQYCNNRFHTRDLSLDHVHPRSLGGALTWDNAVTCCRACNGRKGSLTVDRLRSVGMKLVQKPRVPTSFQLHTVATKLLPRRVHPTWAPYLGTEIEPSPKTDESSQEAMYFEDIA